MRRSIGRINSVSGLLALLFVVGMLGAGACSGAKSRKAPGPTDSETKGAPCTTACCCRVEDDYYRRHVCTTGAECEVAGGECLDPDPSRCRH